MSINIKDAYYEWLCYIVYSGQTDGCYNIVLEYLHKKHFRWFVPNDDNRASEGKNLRERFCDEEDVDFNDIYFAEERVSMLELILGLAFRCDTIMEDNPNNMSISEWFWTLLTNIGLEKFVDEDYVYLGWSSMVNQILEKVINRTYARSGKGGLFPLRHSKKDQRKVELWYQMSEYLVENYYTNL